MRPRAGPRRHYALQDSKLLVKPEGSPTADAILAAVNAVRRRKEGMADRGDGNGGEPLSLPLPRMRLLYHHNDEVRDLTPYKKRSLFLVFLVFVF